MVCTACLKKPVLHVNFGTLKLTCGNNYFYVSLTQSNTDANLPGILMGSIAMVAGFIVFILPETTGKPLPDTIEEVEAQAKKEKRNK